MSRASRHAFVSRMRCRRPRAVPSVALRIVERASELKRLFEKTILLIVHTKRKFDDVGRGGRAHKAMLLHVRKLCAPYLPLKSEACGARVLSNGRCTGKFRLSRRFDENTISPCRLAQACPIPHPRDSVSDRSELYLSDRAPFSTNSGACQPRRTTGLGHCLHAMRRNLIGEHTK